MRPPFLIPQTVSVQGPWSHWQAISTSLKPASLQASPQYLSPGCAMHRHGRCAHLLRSFVVVIIWFSFLLFIGYRRETLFALLRHSYLSGVFTIKHQTGSGWCRQNRVIVSMAPDDPKAEHNYGHDRDYINAAFRTGQTATP